MSVKIKLRQIEIDEYLKGELSSKVRHELVGGQTYTMVGAANIHNLLAGALFAMIRAISNAPVSFVFIPARETEIPYSRLRLPCRAE